MKQYASQFVCQRGTPVRAGFTLVEAVVASGFVGIALAGILSMAPVLLRGQHDIAERSRAVVAAGEMLGMFDRHELPGMEEPVEEKETNPLEGVVTGLVSLLTPAAELNSLESESGEMIRELTTDVAGFKGTLLFDLIDPETLEVTKDSDVAAMITVIIRSGDREVYRMHTVRTNAWSLADLRRSFE